MTVLLADHAWLPGGPADDVLIEIGDGRFTRVESGGSSPDAHRVPGLVLPGFANCHSHAFHRALRGRTHGGGGTFWTWREAMYAVASRLDPDRLRVLATAAFAEMALAGVTTVGEFHYLHHQPDGHPYDDPNAMTDALAAAATDAGIRITVLDAAYLAGGLDGSGHRPIDDTQRRFSDGSVDAWHSRVSGLRPTTSMRFGAAIHSVRSVPFAEMREIAALARSGLGGPTSAVPLHVHVSEQPAENVAALEFYGRTPTQLLADAGVLAPTTSAIHATHLSPGDIALLGGSGCTACICPTTERDLADGIGPARALAEAGTRLSLGTDQHAVIDVLEEARSLEMNERLASLQRGRFPLNDLVAYMTNHPSLGWDDAGTIAIGNRADLVAVRLDSVRTVGCEPAQAIAAATAADIDSVWVDGRRIVEGGQHVIGNVGALLRAAIDPLWF